jgi:hypothetical protein
VSAVGGLMDRDAGESDIDNCISHGPLTPLVQPGRVPNLSLRILKRKSIHVARFLVTARRCRRAKPSPRLLAIGHEAYPPGRRQS